MVTAMSRKAVWHGGLSAGMAVPLFFISIATVLHASNTAMTILGAVEGLVCTWCTVAGWRSWNDVYPDPT